MSKRNQLITATLPDGTTKQIRRKRLLSLIRHDRKHAASKQIHYAGYIVSRRIVKAQSYLRNHGLPHSEAAARLG